MPLKGALVRQQAIAQRIPVHFANDAITLLRRPRFFRWGDPKPVLLDLILNHTPGGYHLRPLWQTEGVFLAAYSPKFPGSFLGNSVMLQFQDPNYAGQTTTACSTFMSMHKDTVWGFDTKFCLANATPAYSYARLTSTLLAMDVTVQPAYDPGCMDPLGCPPAAATAKCGCPLV